MNKDTKKFWKLAREAVKFFRKEEWVASIAKWDEIIPLLQDGSTKASVYARCSYAKTSMGDHEDALTDLERALKIHPQHTGAYNNRGIVRDNMGDHEGAIADYGRALKINPQHAKAYNNRAGTKYNMGDHEGAIADFDQALKIHPQFAEVYSNLGTIKDKKGNHKGAIADYDRAIELNPQHATAHYNRGVTKRKMGDYKGAIADYERAIEIKPTHTNAIHNRAVALVMQDTQKEREELRKKYQAQAKEEYERILKAGEGLIEPEEYEKNLEDYTQKAKWRGRWVWFFSLALTTAAALIFGRIACIGFQEWQAAQSPMAMKVFSPLSLFPFILMGTLVLSPLVWIIRMLNRDKHKYWALREDALANLTLVRIIKSDERKRENLWLQLFDHYDKRSSAHLIADWNRADTGGNSVSVQDILNLVKPGGKSGDS